MIKKFIALGVLSIALSACSNTSVTEKPRIEKPKLRTTNLSNSLRCVYKSIVNSKDRDFGYLFSIPKIIDGTVPENHDGELSDSLQYELINNLQNTLPPGYGIVLTSHPLVLQKTAGDSSFGLNQYGIADSSSLAVLNEAYLSSINSSRSRAQKALPNETISLYKALEPIVIKAAFTRNDSEPLIKKGQAISVGSNGTDGDGLLDIGKTDELSAITLTILLNNPSLNTLKSSTSFTVNSHKLTNSFELSLGPGEGLLGYNKEDLIVESKHGAQQVLIDAATLWILDNTYGDVANIKKCVGNVY